MKLSKGAHAPVPTSLLAVTLSWQSDHEIDAHALLLSESGTVRTDRDLVFYNAPRHISQAVTLNQEPTPGAARLSVSLPRTEADVQRIIISGSVDDGSFRNITGLTLTIHAADGPLATYEVGATEAVAAMMFGEFYRREGEWRFRAIGQGWHDGLRGLIREFGVTTDESSEPAAAHHRPARDAHPPTPRRSGDGLPVELQRQPLDVVLAEQSPAARLQPIGASAAPQAASSTTARSTVRTIANDNHWATRTPDRPVQLGRTRAPELVRDPPAPQDSARADWHADPDDPSHLRWWDGTRWTPDRYAKPRSMPGRRHCARCARPLRRKFFGGSAPCAPCTQEIEEFLTHWHSQATRVLAGAGPQGEDWAALWASLRYQRIDENIGRTALRDAAFSYVERHVAFAFADGEVKQPEFEVFESAIIELALDGPLIDDLRRRMYRGRTLSRLRGGDLPSVATPGLHLDPEELVHLDLPATHVKQLTQNVKLTDGRLIGSNKKLRFVAADMGIELPWTRIVSAHVEHQSVVVAATSARGGATFDVADPDYVAAAMEGALRVAKRLVLTPGQRDTRSIPQEVKAQVWQRDGGKCLECGDSHYLEFDHIIPLSRGGATSATNLQILCRGCNRAKGARI